MRVQSVEMRTIDRLRSAALSAGGLLALALLVGRLSGLGREVVLASYFGISTEADVAIILQTLPDMLVNLLMSGGLSAALVPRLRARDGVAAAHLFRISSLWAASVFSGVAVLIAVWPGAMFSVLAPGLPQPEHVVDRYTMTLLACSVPLTALSGTTSAYLNSGDRYFIAGLGTLIFNISIIAMLLISPDGGSLWILALAIFLGAALRLFSQVVVLPKAAWRNAQVSRGLDRGFALAFAAGVGATSLTLLPPAMVRAAASLLGAGNIAAFNYAQKLVELPLGILITTISTIALTKLSGLYAERREALARETLNAGLRLAVSLAIFITLFGMALTEPVVAMVFERGSIDAGDVREISALTRIALLGVPFIAVSSLAASALNAQLRTAEVLRATILSVGALVIFLAPGLIASSETALMGAMVGSQALLSWRLASKAGICFWGPAGFVQRQSIKAIGSALAVAVTFSTIAIYFSAFSAAAGICLGAAGFAASIATVYVIDRE